MEQGILPVAAGWEEQSATFVAAIRILAQQKAKWDEAKMPKGA